MTHGRPPQLRAGSAWALASVAVALAAGFIRTIVVARFLEPVDIGLMGAALLAIGFLEAVASTGTDTALVAHQHDVDSYLDPAFTIQVVRGVVVSGLLWAAAPVIAWGFQIDAAVSVIRAVGVIPALRGLANPAIALPIRRLDFRRVFWWSLPELLCSVAVTVALAAAWGNVWALVVGTVSGQLVATAASYGIVRRMPRVVFARHRLYELLQFGRFVSGSRALMYFSVNVDAAIVGIAMGTRALGLYQFAMRAAELPAMAVTRALAQVALPALSGERVGTDAMTLTWRRLTRAAITVNAAAAALILLFGDAAVGVIAGEQWVAAIPVMRILAVAMIFRAIVVMSGQLFDAMRRPALTLRLNAMRLAVLVVLVPVCAGYGGLQGVAAAVLLGNAGAAALAARFSARVLAR